MQVTPNQNTQKVNNVPPYSGAQVTNPQTQQIQPQVQQYCAQAAAPSTPPNTPPNNQPQNVQIPATTSGVNIQIFNPSAIGPGANPPTYNVNAPCYPSAYYTGSLDSNGKMQPNYNPQQVNGGNNNGNGSSNANGNGNNVNSTDTNKTTNTTTTENSSNKKKTEKRNVVQIDDNYIRTLENGLNSQDEKIRMNAAKEVYARLEEDEDNKDDKALTALINKMLQDPADEVRFLALAALQERIVLGDDYTVNVLKNMQQSDGGYGQDAIDASKILMQMAGKQVEKEFEVKDSPNKTETKTETEAKTETSNTNNEVKNK